MNGTGTWSGVGAVRNNLTINTAGTITISGTINYNTGTLTYTAGTVTTTGSTLTIALSTTLNTSGMTWNNVTSTSITLTLSSDLNIGGILTTNGILNLIGTYAINVSGGLTLNERVQQSSGTTTLNILGGTWSSSIANALISINTNINGNVTVSGSVSYTAGTLTYVSGTVVTTGSTLNITTTSCTLNTNGIIWNNVTSGATGVAVNLTSDLNINGTLTTTASSVLTFSGTYNITVAGGVVANERILKNTGTPTLIITGGTWSCGAAGVITINTNINGNVTISGTVNYHTGTLTYISGTVLTGGSTLSTLLTAVTFNTDGIAWNNVALGVLTTLTSNLTVNGLLTTSTVINGANIYANGGITVGNNSSGTTVIWLQGGTWSGVNMIRNNTFINGNIRISGSVAFNGATLTYSSGTVVAKGSTLNINGVSTTLINIHKINFDTVIITSSLTVIMNEFFSGSPNLPVKVQASSAATNYTITFQNGFEKIAKYVKISNLTLTNTAASRGGLLILNNKGKYFTGGNNIGNIRYINQSPNGISKGNPTVPNPMTTPIGGYVSDPVFN
jgi:hypothetical protein